MSSKRQGRSRRYLIDTSALYPMLLKGIQIDPDRFAVTTLTEYEIGNVLWKEGRNKRLKDPKRVAEIFEDAIKNLERYGIGSIPEVLRLALDMKLTFYDASYIHIAKSEGFVLVTEDSALLKMSKNAVNVDGLKRSL